MVAVAIADEATIRQLDKYKQITAQLTDPRKLPEAEAKQLIATGKPIYYAIGSIHSPELGSPEMLMELAFRLAVEEIAVHPDDPQQLHRRVHARRPKWTAARSRSTTSTAQKKPGKPPPRSSTGASTSQHDNNRDGIGVGLQADAEHARARFSTGIRPVCHDLHESVTLLYTSDRHRALQHRRRSDPGRRVVAAGAERDDGDGQARRARRVDLQLLRRLGPELHVLDRRHAQLDRPVLRDAELSRRELRAQRPDHDESREWYRPNPPRQRSSGGRATTSTCSRARS